MTLNKTRGKAAALVYGPELHHLDHLAALSRLLNIPLIVTEEEISALVRTYYPQSEVLFYDYSQISEQLVSRYSIVFTALPRDLFEELFFFAQRLLGKRVHTLWVPHGNSDKGHLAPFMEGLKKEEVLLVYGQKMIDFLRSKGALDQAQAHVVTGNFRYLYYKREKTFYQKLIEKEITAHLPKRPKTYLYAPTWQDSESSSSFFGAVSLLIESLPDDCNLIIKPHPHLLRETKTTQLLLRYEEREGVFFLNEFPPIYPLLDAVDVYIGDLSSVGYDFLTFDKPMFFLNQSRRSVHNDPGLYLYQCGVTLEPEHYADIYRAIDFHVTSDQEDFSAIRKQVYNYTFGEEKSVERLQREIFETFSLFADSELDFL